MVTAGMVFASNIMLAQLLSPQELGAYFLAFSLVTLGALLGQGGLGLAAVRFIAESVGLGQLGRARQMVRIIFGLGLPGSLLMGVAYLIFGDVLGAGLFHSSALVAVTGLVAGWIIVMALQGLLAEAFRGFYDIRLASVFGGTISGILLAGCLGALWLARERATLDTVLLLAVGSGLANALLASWFLRQKVTSLPSVDASLKVKEVLNVSWPLLTASLTYYMLTQADVWVLGTFRSEEEVGIYGLTVRLVTLLSMPLLIVNSVTPPLITEMYVRGERRELERVLRTISTLVALLTAPVLVAFVLFGGPILGVVFGEFYREGATALAVLSLGQLAAFWSGSCGMLLNMTGHQYPAMVITAFSAVVAVTVALATINSLGLLGAALGTSIGLTVQNLTLALYSYRIIGIKSYMVLPLGFKIGRLFR